MKKTTVSRRRLTLSSSTVRFRLAAALPPAQLRTVGGGAGTNEGGTDPTTSASDKAHSCGG